MKKTDQKIYYDKKTDVLWFLIKSGPEETHKELSPGVSVELGKNGELLGIEILDATKILGPKLGFKTKTQPVSFAHSIKIKK
ncbi:MAG: DUF2283 domain-containing protein [Candidatus Daviesbacteria bacterium]|nr:DUF2283 domain-containing protein [Candidatus Daviesbacteria bacterium]